MDFSKLEDQVDTDRNMGVVYPGMQVPQLPAFGARWHALVALRKFLTTLVYRREEAEGKTQAFKIPEDRIHLYTPENVDERELKTGFAVLPGPYSYDEKWVYSMGRPEAEENTQDVYGPGTVVMTLGYYVEQITLEAVAQSYGIVRGMIEGARTACRFFTDSGQLYLKCPDYYGQEAAFTVVSGAGYSADVVSEVSGRRMAHLQLELWVPEVILIPYTTLRVIPDYGPNDSYIRDGNVYPTLG